MFEQSRKEGIWDFLFFLARVLFSLIFISSGIGHLTNNDQMAQYAASKNVLAPKVSVLFPGTVILLGGLSVAFGV